MVWLIAAVALANVGPAERAKSCKILKADYAAAGKPQYRLKFVKLGSPAVSDIGLHIFSSDPRAELWYFPDEGSAPRVSLISTTNPTVPGWHPEPDGGVRPHGSATLIAMAADGTIMPNVVTSRSRAPRYVIVPELGQVYKGIGSVAYWPAAFVLKSCHR